jgi:hypothetical protein
VCVPSILKSSSKESELLVTLNEADEESIAYLDSLGVKHLDSPTNLNVSGMDLFIPYIREAGHKYVVVVSSDMLYSNGWDEKQIALLEQNYPCSTSGCLVEPVYGGCEIYDQLDFYREGAHDLFNENVAKGKYAAQPCIAYQHPIMCRAEDFLNVNGYSDGMDPIWIEAQGRAQDDYYAYRLFLLHERNFKYLKCTDAFIYHAISLNTKKHPIPYTNLGGKIFTERTGITVKDFHTILGA